MKSGAFFNISSAELLRFAEFSESLTYLHGRERTSKLIALSMTPLLRLTGSCGATDSGVK